MNAKKIIGVVAIIGVGAVIYALYKRSKKGSEIKVKGIKRKPAIKGDIRSKLMAKRQMKG